MGQPVGAGVTRRVDREGPVHRAILAYLRTVLPDAVIHHSPNETDMAGADVARQKAAALGTRAGWPDIECIWHGRFLAFEVKAPGGRVTPQQRATGVAIAEAGGHYAVVRSIDDARLALAAWGIATREASRA